MPSKPSCILSVDAFVPPDEDRWDNAYVPQARAAGFDTLLWRGDAGSWLERRVPDAVIRSSVDAGLAMLVEVDVTAFPIGHPLVFSNPKLFAVRREGGTDAAVDPRHVPVACGRAIARLAGDTAQDVLLPAIVDRLLALLDMGVAGFRFVGAERIPPAFLKALLVQLRTQHPDMVALVGAEDTSAAKALGDAGVDGLVSGGGKREGHTVDLVDEREALRGIAPLIVEPLLARGDVSRTLLTAAVIGDGVIVPLPIAERDPVLMERVVATLRQAWRFGGEMRRLGESGRAIAAVLRADATDVRAARSVLVTLVNTTDREQSAPDPTIALAGAGFAFAGFDPDAFAAFGPGEVRVLTAEAAPAVIAPGASSGLREAATAPRLVIEDVAPHVDGGYPVKRVVGDMVSVEATIFADGHEQLAAELLWRAVDQDDWTVVPMAEAPNYCWHARFVPTRLGRHEFVIEAWLDRFGGFTRDFRKKLDAGVAQPVDFAEGRLLVEQARDRAAGALRTELARFADGLAGDTNAVLLLSDDLAAVMQRADDRPHRLQSAVQPLDAERLAARFSSWYELFPRSQAEGRHGTFRDVIARLPAVRDMGFDTLYFPPIHPIGTTNRKGPNNTLTPAPGDPGSPYAIGAPEGGHEAIHPELGGLDDFLALVAAAREHGLEIALDFAIQCSPDHPWLKDHPGWFAWRPDGSMKYAENPPKKYQDIVNVDFYGPDAVPGLWSELRDIILLWVERGVKTFRVDNPHTKTLPFWEWMIGDVRAAHPDVIFLAEAFTKPAMMYRLAKIGFSQSYTYFTWRDGKAELTEYITELTTTAPKEFYRPHFFVNTPDINPVFLQTSGRPGFRIRAVLAATLSGLFGVYSGFELCEAAPIPGKEEYLDSEKFELRPRDWNAPGNIIADITLLNRLRRAHPALQTHLNTRFHAAYNDNILYYAKPSLDGADIILVMVSLDPHHAQEADFEVPLWEFGLPDDASVAVEDLAEGYRFDWHGKTQHIRLDPEQPYRIWRIAPGDRA